MNEFFNVEIKQSRGGKIDGGVGEVEMAISYPDRRVETKFLRARKASNNHFEYSLASESIFAPRSDATPERAPEVVFREDVESTRYAPAARCARSICRVMGKYCR